LSSPATTSPRPARTNALSRSQRIAALGFVVFVFLGVSLLLARGFTATSRERGAVSDLVRAEVPACAHQPACAAATAGRVAKLRRPGTVEILQYEASTQLALTNRVGTGRVAWRVDDGLPVVQCVRVQRNGPLTGGGVELLAVSAPIGRQASCP
jgi:hypothetical protein